MGNNNLDLKKHFRDYFILSKDERRAAVVILIIITALIIFPGVYQYFFSPTLEKADDLVISEVNTLVALQNSKPAKTGYDRPITEGYATKKVPAEGFSGKTALFPFDPNTTDTETWLRLGVPQKTITTIQNYLGKGGRFRKPEDLTRIYGLPRLLGERLLPYVKITERPNKREYPAADNHNKDLIPGYTKNKPNNTPKAESLPVDINTADSSVFVRLPGIGSKLSARIVNYRNKLGGFYNILQIAETYGLPDSTFQMIKPRLTINKTALVKININLASAQELKHPYLTWKMANALVAYRNQHGPFKAVTDLSKVVLIDEAAFRKIEPYLSTE